MLGQLLIAEMRDSQALASCQHAFVQAMGELGRPQAPRALQCAERKNAALALLDEIIRRESVWWVRSAVRAGLLFGCTRFLTRNNRSYCRWGWIQYQAEAPMRFEKLSFGSIRIDGTMYEHDVVIDRGDVRKRKKKPSKKFRGEFGHTPLSVEEKIPWKCRRLVIGTGTAALPVMKDVKREAKRRKIKLLILPANQAIKELKQKPVGTNAVLHVTC